MGWNCYQKKFFVKVFWTSQEKQKIVAGCENEDLPSR